MSQAPAYDPATDFSDEERDNVGGRSTVRTAALDAELTSIATTANALRANLFLIQRDDGNLRDSVVKLFTLAPDVLNLLVTQGDATPRGAWLTATGYNLKDIVSQGGSTYIAAVAHTSGVFADDLTAIKWLLIANPSQIASTIPFTPTGTIAATNVQAAIEESDTENRALSVLAQANAIASVLASLASSTLITQGTGLIGHNRALTYTSGTAGFEINEALADSGLSPSGGDDTAAIVAELAAEGFVRLRGGTFQISNKITLTSGQMFSLSPNTVIQQLTANTPIFEAISQSNIIVECRGALLIGEGTWSAGWTGSGGHEDKAFHFVACTNVTIDRPRIRNCGLAGINIVGGSRIRITSPTIEGTHLYSTALPASANFQFGIYLANDPVQGAVNDCQIIAPNISGVAIGILDEQEVGAPQRTDAVVVIGANIHDIPGQHAFYLTASRINLVGASVTDINLAGVKIQAGDANQDIVGVSAIGIQANNLGSQMFEVAVPTPFTGKIRGTRLQGVGTNVQRGISCARRVENLVADIVVETCTDVAVNLQDADLKDIDITVAARNCALDGIVITATTSTGIKLRPTLRECNTTTTAGKCGIRIDSASAAVEVFDADITDASTKMVYGIHNATVGSTVAVRGSIKVSGASDTAIRAVGAITEFPGAATLQGTNGQFIGIANVQFTGFLQTAIVTSSASNVVIWQQTLPPDSAVLVTVELVGILTGTSQRRAVVVNGLFYRVGTGICTIEGAPSVVSNIASGAFGGVYSLQSNGASEVILQVNSGGAAFYQWQARIRVTRVS